mgnify:CR=1 FL=1
MANKWTDDEDAVLRFDLMMGQTWIPMNQWMESMKPYFDNTPSSVVMRLVGFAMFHYSEARMDNSPTDAIEVMVQELSKNPELANLMMMGRGVQ